MRIAKGLSDEAKKIVNAWYPKVFKKEFFICKHCSCPCTGVYCDDCGTAKQRKEMDEANQVQEAVIKENETTV